jgi:predicted DNA-binding antitoxin AbrB/MazE fold protein
MLKTYEAIYENGQLKWVSEEPDIKSARILITVMEEYSSSAEERARVAAKALAQLEGTEPVLEDIPRRRWNAHHEDSG